MASILIVDDEAPIRALLSRLVLMHGHTVKTASDGDEALDLIRTKRFDLLIIDRNMPRLSGIDAVSALRTSSLHDKLKILMITGASMNKEVEEAFEAGVDGYMLKPLDLEKVVAKIEQTLAF